MKRLFLLGVWMAWTILTIATSTAAAAANEAPPVPTLTVNGRGSVQGAADQATISLGVTTYSTVARDAQERNAAASQSIFAALEEFGITAHDLQTQNYNFSPEYSYEDAQRGTITGYTVNNTLLVRIDDIAKIGQIIDAALTHGANNVNALEFSFRDARPLRREALTSAVKDAREKAEVIARAMGKSIVGVVRVSEGSASTPPYFKERMMANAAGFGAETPIEGGTLTLSADVEIEFRLSD